MPISFVGFFSALGMGHFLTSERKKHDATLKSLVFPSAEFPGNCILKSF
jgi:hypothetical protein